MTRPSFSALRTIGRQRPPARHHRPVESRIDASTADRASLAFAAGFAAAALFRRDCVRQVDHRPLNEAWIGPPSRRRAGSRTVPCGLGPTEHERSSRSGDSAHRRVVGPAAHATPSPSAWMRRCRPAGRDPSTQTRRASSPGCRPACASRAARRPAPPGSGRRRPCNCPRPSRRSVKVACSGCGAGQRRRASSPAAASCCALASRRDA